MSDLSFAAGVTVPRAVAVRVKLKWFNTEKGFGFVSPLDGQPEAFLHATVLPRGPACQLAEGAEMLCEIAPGAKGPQVVRVAEILAGPSQPEPSPQLPGLVKWYQSEKGFGFITADDGGRDVFVHQSALKRSGLDGLAPGQAVLMAVVETVKGREARRLVLACPAEPAPGQG